MSTCLCGHPLGAHLIIAPRPCVECPCKAWAEHRRTVMGPLAPSLYDPWETDPRTAALRAARDETRAALRDIATTVGARVSEEASSAFHAMVADEVGVVVVKLRAERDEARAQVAAAYEAAGEECARVQGLDISDEAAQDERSAECAAEYREGFADGAAICTGRMRALAPADARGALDATIAKAREEGRAQVAELWATTLAEDLEQKLAAARREGAKSLTPPAELVERVREAQQRFGAARDVPGVEAATRAADASLDEGVAKWALADWLLVALGREGA